MFEEWGFLLAEIWFLLAVAALIGLLAGWIIWARGDAVATGAPVDTGEADRLRADLAACRARGDGLAAQVADLEAKLAARLAAPAAALMGGAAAVRPAALDAPRGGKADDLKLIKGVGPKLEALCNKLGFWHFDQIANWTPAEVAWVDENLEGFKGRVSREDWITQARALAAGKAAPDSGKA